MEWNGMKARKKESKKERKKERAARKHVPFQISRTGRLIACVETPHSDGTEDEGTVPPSDA